MVAGVHGALQELFRSEQMLMQSEDIFNEYVKV